MRQTSGMSQSLNQVEKWKWPW